MTRLRFASLAAAAFVLSGQTAPPKYAVGQIWEYRNRPQDAGSLLKVQQIADFGRDKVYHLSIIGVHFATPGISGVLPHIPVSETTLDASVTHLSSADTDFPTTALQEGIAEWQKAKGGIFTIPMSQIMDIVDDQTGRRQATAEAEVVGI
ncbi:hypothetical protein [Sphingobium sp. D43FB]|uniref:hypothetical protein n=1 Tax=Sphingobium sp. D43FB TaxID=2017595 RepID=UPI00114225B6|nr:hypothetical protein [Sphingobium sp. D43FB]